MLFLLNTQIIEIASPEAHLLQNWRRLGCGDPRTLRAQDAIAFACDRLADMRRAGQGLDQDTANDLSALIIAKTGANALTLKPAANGGVEPRLMNLPLLVLEAYQRGAVNDGGYTGRLQRA